MPTEAEIAAMTARGPATGVWDSRGKLRGFQDIGTLRGSKPAVDTDRLSPHDRNPDGSRVNNDSGLSPAPSASGAAATAPVVAATPPAAPQTEINVQDYQSSNPESMYDPDIRFTHTLSRMLGMAGLGDKAASVRALNMQMQMSRVQDLTTQAQRSLIAGDISKAIDVFNHAVPNGRQITGYAQNPDKTFLLRYSDGQTETRTAGEIAEGLTAFGDPKIMAQMILNRSKSLAELNKDLTVATVKGQMSYAQAMATAQVNAQSRMALARFNAEHGANNVKVDVAGKIVAVDDHMGNTFVPKIIDLNGKKEEVFVKLNLPKPSPGSSGMGGAVGTTVNPSAIALPIPSQYAAP